MPRHVSSVFVPVPPDEVWAWHARPGAAARQVPGWSGVRLVRPPVGLRDGTQAELSVPAWPLRRRWTVETTDCRPGQGFVDRQLRGPFGAWEHRRRFLPEEDGCRVEDAVEWRAPLGALGAALTHARIGGRLERALAWRGQRLVADLGRHRDFRDAAPLRIAIAGASGMVGGELQAFLASGGHTVLPLVRPGSRSAGIPWDPACGGLDAEALARCDAVVHLGGHPIAGRWTSAERRRILDSRVESTRLLAESLARAPQRPRTLIVASGVGIYGDRGDELVDELSAGGDGFLADVCRAWEAACEPARAAGVRVVNLRIGLVVSARGGALPRMLAPHRLGLGGAMGSGRQWISWIALDDLVYLIHHVLRTDTVAGAVNAVAPVPVRASEFADAIAHALRTRARMRVPAWAVRAALGDMGRELLLGGCRVVSRALEQEVFAFSRPSLREALRWELGLIDRPRPAENGTSSSPFG